MFLTVVSPWAPHGPQKDEGSNATWTWWEVGVRRVNYLETVHGRLARAGGKEIAETAPCFLSNVLFLKGCRLSDILHPPSLIPCWHGVTMGRLPTSTQKYYLCTFGNLNDERHAFVFILFQLPRLEAGLKANSHILKQGCTISRGVV